ncbi:unnamed protein product [Calicophoron daubneyi]|uniref:Uncharacterized protein n=1 Tax=Calicophoron daubneyi TaxID=300641 RepID=A0AAV2SYH6_CALDB
MISGSIHNNEVKRRYSSSKTSYAEAYFGKCDSNKTSVASTQGRQTGWISRNSGNDPPRNSHSAENENSLLLADESLRIITIQIRRLRGISNQLQRGTNALFLFEIMGLCISCSECFTNLPGFQFVLQELGVPSAATVTCAFYDFDGICPSTQLGKTYRCVGRYHARKLVFQCFSIEECDNDLVRLVEAFQFLSDGEVTKIIRAKNEISPSSCGSRRVSRIPYTGWTGTRMNNFKSLEWGYKEKN